jgi:hypothetical protein
MTYEFYADLLNVLVQIENKIGLQKKVTNSGLPSKNLFFPPSSGVKVSRTWKKLLLINFQSIHSDPVSQLYKIFSYLHSIIFPNIKWLASILSPSRTLTLPSQLGYQRDIGLSLFAGEEYHDTAQFQCWLTECSPSGPLLLQHSYSSNTCSLGDATQTIQTAAARPPTQCTVGHNTRQPEVSAILLCLWILVKPVAISLLRTIPNNRRTNGGVLVIMDVDLILYIPTRCDYHVGIFLRLLPEYNKTCKAITATGRGSL